MTTTEEDSWCGDDVPATAAAISWWWASWIGWIGSSLLIVSLMHATLAQGRPLTELGKRPRGRNLLQFLYYYYVNDSGVRGYDPIQGALSPPLRLAMHVSCILILWSCSTLLYSSLVVDDDDACRNEHGTAGTTTTMMMMLPPPIIWTMGLYTSIAYLTTCLLVHHVLFKGVSVPDGPRPHKIQRVPCWPDRHYALPNNSTTTTTLRQLRYATGRDSHRGSETRFAGTAAALTGEPVGRDIWTTVAEEPQQQQQQQKKKGSVDERVVLELAAGGRPLHGFNPSKNPNSADQIFRAQLIRHYLQQPGNQPPPPPRVDDDDDSKTIQDATKQGAHFYSMLLSEDGHWSGDYGGPLFLMPGLVVAWYVMGRPTKMLDPAQIALMKHYLVVHQQSDGGWGTHIESPSTMFGTTLSYVSLRLFGMPPDDPVCVAGRKFIRDQGGAIMTSSWAKFSLCLLGCMEWDGHNAVPPEMWLLPNWVPFHPGRMWCHARMVYLPMGYLYGARFVYDKAESDPLIAALREELYCEPYGSIPWIKTRHLVAEMDNYSPLPWTMAFLQNMMACYETWSIFQPFKNFVRKRGLAFSLQYMAAEDLQTNFIDIGPVNKVFNMLSAYHAVGGDINHTRVMNHLIRVEDYLWLAEDGLKMKGYNGSQCWDTSFAIQAYYEANLVEKFPQVAKKVWSYFERCQILSTETSQSTAAFRYESAENRKSFYRHISQGGWPFSTSAHGWPISDCTAEGLKGVLCLMKSQTVQDAIAKGEIKPIGEKRLQMAANVLLSYQNEDGGFATYENNRGFGWYESLNPSEVFGDIMIDYSYVECSMAALTGLVEFNETYPDHRTDEIKHAINKGRDFLKSIQRADGSWYGSWACCFCYGCWFGVEGLVKCGEPLTSDAIKRACTFLLRQQRPNGGWGEDFTSCYDKDYAKDGMKAYGDEGSGVVNTSWALLALSAARYQDIAAVKRGVRYLMKRQLPSGDFPQEGISGVFNRACGITYTAYRNVFPIWALGRCREVYGTALDK